MKLRKLNTKGVSHLLLPVVIVLVVAGIGSYVYARAHAQTICGSEGGTTEGSACYFWNGGWQTGIVATGAQVDISQEAPRFSAADQNAGGHVSSEMFVLDASGADGIEMGWAVDKASQTRPFFFAHSWRDHVPYRTNFTPVSGASVKQYSPLAVGAVGTFKVNYANSQWKLYYDGKEVGYFPGSDWGGKFTHVKEVNIFGEVTASTSVRTTTQMGDGLYGPKANSAYFTHYSLIGSSNLPVLDVTGTKGAIATGYQVGRISTAGFHYGGPGF